MRSRELANAPWLSSKSAMRVLDLLDTDGEEARIVGGAVRDALLALPVGEIDIATTAEPREVMRRAAAARIKAVPTGIDHGTITLIAEGETFEVTTLREDVETFGRKARVAFGRDWARDAQRRDFTINALSWSRDGIVHDYSDGLDDIAARSVRFIGDPDRRIAEDYLRILRFFRIHAAYGVGSPDRAARDACMRGRAGLAHLSAERIRAELLKLFAAANAPQALDAMAGCGLLIPILGSVTYPGTLRRMIEAERLLALPVDPIRRLAGFAVSVPEDAERLAGRLRLSNAETKRLKAMGDGWWRLTVGDETPAKYALYEIGPELFRDRAMLAFARRGGDADAWQALATLPDRWVAPKFPVKATDFIARGFAEGPALGHVLGLAERAWIAAGYPLEPSIVEKIADDSAARFRREHRL